MSMITYSFFTTYVYDILFFLQLMYMIDFICDNLYL
jgi:hypothetical protein